VTPLERAYRRTFQSFETPNFRVYALGQGISGIGSWMQFAGQAWLVFQLTDSEVAVGALAALQFAPILVLGAWGGLIVDRLDKRRLLIATQTIAGLLALVLGVIVAAGIVEVWMVYVLASALGTVMAFDNPARRAFVPELVPVKDLANGVALNSSIFTVARIVGPAAAGFVIVGIGIQWCFIVNAASYVVAVWTFALIHPADLHTSVPVTRAKRQLREGLHYAWRNVPVRTSLLLTAFVATFAFNYQVVMPIIAKREFDGNASTYGTLMAVIGIGSLVGALWSAHFGRASLRITILSTIALGFSTTAAALVPSLQLEYLVLPFVGLTSMALVTMATAVCNAETAPEFRGRVMALFAIAFLGSTPIGGPISGVVMEAFGPRAGLALGAIAAFVGGFVALTYQRRHMEVEVPIEGIDVALAPHAAAVP
jgi:MFS family permease